MTTKSRILIVGAGAMGMASGYHLSLAGAEVAFLVRPSRVEALSRPQILYSYDDASLKTFSGYQILSDVNLVANTAYDYVIVTLDGAATRTAEGTALLRALGKAVRDTSAVVITGGVGIGLREHYLQSLELAGERVLSGALGLFCHQVAGSDLPVHPPTDPALLAQADMAYRHHSNSGFTLDNRSPAAAKRFAALYDACGVSRCAVMDAGLFSIIMKVPFPVFAASELLGWPAAAALPKSRALWGLTSGAAREIAGLKTHGWKGKVVALLLNRITLAKMWSATEKAALPLDFQAFNAFHHGSKVRAQDMEILRACVVAGELEGKKMKALRQLMIRVDSGR